MFSLSLLFSYLFLVAQYESWTMSLAVMVSRNGQRFSTSYSPRRTGCAPAPLFHELQAGPHPYLQPLRMALHLRGICEIVACACDLRFIEQLSQSMRPRPALTFKA